MEASTHIEIAAPIGAVAARLLDFAHLDRWHPGVAELVVEGQGPGAVRTYRLGKDRFRERLEAVDDDGHGLTYTVLETPLAITSLIARYRLVERASRTRVEWIAELSSPAFLPAVKELEGAMALAVVALEDASLALLQASLEQGVDLVSP